MNDKILRAVSSNGAIRMYMAKTTNLVNRAVQIHKTYPIATAALGRLLTAASMMGLMLKSEKETLTLQVKGDGPLKGIMAVGNFKAEVKGYAVNPRVILPSKTKGKLNVGGAVGKGVLAVIKDFGLKEPYVAQIPLVSGEIAEDLTAYYATSEQTPTSVALGVLVDTDGSVLNAGGFFLQLMPEATEEDAIKLEDNIKQLSPVTTMLKDGMSLENIIFTVTKGFDMLIYNKDTVVPKYVCGCTRERVERAIISIGRNELESLIAEQGNANITCQFCDNVYDFSKDDLKQLLKQAK